MTQRRSPLLQHVVTALLLGSVLFASTSVRAQQSAPGFAAELRWASQVRALPAGAGAEYEGALAPTEHLGSTADGSTGTSNAAIASPAPDATPWSSPGRALHRYRLMAALGYSLAGLAAGLTAGAAAMRRDCQSPESGPSNRFGLLYVSAPVMGLGLSVGAIGSIRAALLRRRHGTVAPVPFSGPRGPVLAAFTTLLVFGGLVGGTASSAVCFS